MSRSDLRVIFRVAAGPKIGFGHLMRCRALARALGVPPVVSIRGSQQTRATAQRLGCQLFDGPLAESGAHVLVVDDPSPAHLDAWLVRGRLLGLPTLAIRDGGDSGAGADVVVDCSVASVSSTTPELLAGPRFTILDPRVLLARDARLETRPLRRQPEVLVSLGGGEHVIAAVPRLARHLRRACPSARIVVATGFSGRATPAIGGVRWIDRRDGLMHDLARCDVAIVAGGVTLYEACAIGTPVIAVTVVPAQRRAVYALSSAGAIVDGGPAGAASDHLAAAVSRALALPARGFMNTTGRRIIDGRGALRVAARIRRLAAAPSRPASANAAAAGTSRHA